MEEGNDFCEVRNRKSVSCSLGPFTYNSRVLDTIEMVEWANGDGWDISISLSNGSERFFSLHSSELEAINYLRYVLDYDLIKK